jgi:hypothetical protein
MACGLKGILQMLPGDPPEQGTGFKDQSLHSSVHAVLLSGLNRAGKTIPDLYLQIQAFSLPSGILSSELKGGRNDDTKDHTH